jgi:hypothetical protein
MAAPPSGFGADGLLLWPPLCLEQFRRLTPVRWTTREQPCNAGQDHRATLTNMEAVECLEGKLGLQCLCKQFPIARPDTSFDLWRAVGLVNIVVFKTDPIQYTVSLYDTAHFHQPIQSAYIYMALQTVILLRNSSFLTSIIGSTDEIIIPKSPHDKQTFRDFRDQVGLDKIVELSGVGRLKMCACAYCC